MEPRTDTFSENERSQIMRKVRSSGNRSTELRLIDLFRAHSVKGWRRRFRLLGHPDFVFPAKRTVVFADGCFWHGHDCRNTSPKGNAEYWKKKIQRTRERDRLITSELREKGWRVIRVWECELRTKELPLRFSSLLEPTEASIRKALEEAERDIAEGRILTHEEVVKRMKRWLK